jgi:hypothetical protein
MAFLLDAQTEQKASLKEITDGHPTPLVCWQLAA